MKDLKTIEKAIASIASRGKRLDSDIQHTAVDVLEHFTKHRDTGLVNRLYLAMPKGTRGTALAQWLLMFMPLEVNTGETRKEQPFLYVKAKVGMLTPENIEKAKASMWYDMRKEPDLAQVFDLKTAFRSMLKKMEKAASIEHYNREALLHMAKAVGIPESDVPMNKHGKAAKAAAAEKAVGVATH